MGATLLVTASVAEWSEAIIQQDIDFAELDEKIADFAAAAGFDPLQRLPFLIEGKVQDFPYHIIDGSKLVAGGTSHQDHLAASIQVSAGTTDATLIGFYSDHAMIPAGSTIRFPLK
ncbi:MAG: hypothetical protein H8E15_02775 [Planctomycetes bacterium]|nr:hypothetical protein [Planctomycetota bacterium]